jgi:pimeloyl-ACP methyl ester carboxylesterase
LISPKNISYSYNHANEDDALWKIHSLHISIPNTKGTKPVLLFVHGLGSSGALALSTSAIQLAQYYDIYTIDLPGFGRSLAPSSIVLESTDTILSQYVLCISKLIEILHLPPVEYIYIYTHFTTLCFYNSIF